MDAKHAFPRAAALALAVSVVGSGCVRGSTFRTEMEALRGEMAAGDAQVDQRVSGVAGEVDALESRVNALETRLSTLERELQQLETEFGAEIERLEASLRVFTPVHFAFDQADLAADQTQVLERLSGVLREFYPEALVTVEGFTDAAGSAAYNLRLGQRRADAVRTYLLTQGMAEGQIRAVSYGEDASRLVRAGAAGQEAGRENRRVVIVIDHADATAAAAMSSTGG